MPAQQLFKAVRPDGLDFRDQSFRWIPATGDPAGTIVTHPRPTLVGARNASGYLSVATVATDCTGAQWPCRLLAVEPIGETWQPDPEDMRQLIAGHAFRVMEELPAHLVFGEQGEHVVALVERIGRMTGEEIERVDASWDASRVASRVAAWAASRGASRVAARVAAWGAARAATRVAAWDAARAATRDAVTALLVRDLLTGEQGRRHYDVLTRPLRLAGITVHPDDPAVTE